MKEPASITPGTASAYNATLCARPEGTFISSLRNSAQTWLATVYGGPFFAISRLAPELLTTSNASVLIADTSGTYARSGGRWLTLYSKVVQPAPQISITVCAAKRPAYGREFKPILFQKPHQIMAKSWDKHLHALDVLPDLTILPIAGEFENLLSAVNSLRRLSAGHKALVPCDLKVEALIVRALFDAFGFMTSEVIGFDLADGVPQHFEKGAWWLSVQVPAKENASQPPQAVLDKLARASLALNRLIAPIEPAEAFSEIAATVATRRDVSVGGEEVRAVMVSPAGGIDLESGRFFKTTTDPESTTDTEVATGSNYGWDTSTIDADLLAQVPAAGSLSEDADRLALMHWIASVLAALDKRELDAPTEGLNPPPTEPDPPHDSSPATDDTQSAPETAPQTGSEVIPQDVTGSEAPRKPQHPRLSRHAGTVNVLAIAARLGRAGRSSSGTFATTRTRILRWLQNKGFSVTDTTGNSHIELPEGEVTIESDGERIWALRYDDRRAMEQGAIWRVEATIIDGDQPAMGLRLIQVRRSEEAPLPVESGVPQVVADIADEVGLTDAGIGLHSTCTQMQGVKDAQRLVQLLLNPDRIQPVIVIAGEIDTSANRLAKRLTGVAHLIGIDAQISNHLIRAFGRGRAVFGHAVRLYRPGFNAEADPYLHPVWPLKGNQLPKWLVNDLFEEACATSTAAEGLDERVPPFQAVRQILATERVRLSEERVASLQQQASKAKASKDEKISQLQGIRSELESALVAHRTKANELSAQIEELKNELLATRRERDEAREELRRSTYRFHAQWNENEEQAEETTNEVVYPDSWDYLEAWVEQYGDGKLELHPKAIKAARESPFKDIPLAYKAMDYLVRYYIPMRTRSADDNEAYQRSRQALAALGLEESDVGTADEIRRYKREYQRQYGEKTVTLDRHLKRGVGFGGDFQFRLYFYYDDKAGKVLVGHMPTHLTNRLTHNG